MKKFFIKSNSHYSWGFHHFGIIFKNKISFRAKFDASCLYDLKNSNNYDINKLFGFSTTYFHQNQSARIGWRRKDDESFEIVTYTYNDGKRSDPSVLGIVKPNETFTCTIEDIETHYKYTFYKVFEDEFVFNIKHDIKKKDKVLFKYLLWPYFGGDQKAPHDMVIYLQRI